MTLRNIIVQLGEDLNAALELAAGFKFPDFERDTEYVSLTADSEYAMLDGEVISSDGVRKDKSEYKNITNEYLVKHSTAKHAKLSRNSYMVGGALARFNNNYDSLCQAAKNAAEFLGLKPKCINLFEHCRSACRVFSLC